MLMQSWLCVWETKSLCFKTSMMDGWREWRNAPDSWVSSLQAVSQTHAQFETRVRTRVTLQVNHETMLST